MLHFLIAPDFPPEDFAGWHLFNTHLQRLIDTDVRLEMPTSHQEQEEIINQDKLALVYANPFDAANLVRERGYIPLVRPIARPDEMIIASYAEAPYQHSDDLKSGCKILVTDNYDVQLLGLRLLESASLNKDHIEWLHVDSYQEAARRLIEQEADAAFFLASAYQSFRANTLNKLKPLMESHINDLSHIVLLHPQYSEWRAKLLPAFLNMTNEADGKLVLQDLNIPQGFAELKEEDAEFMIDLMETLRD